MKKIRDTKAFTLIELLVVIAIIALLLTILLPALRKARAGAWKAVCASHLHQVAVALEAYEGQYDYKRFSVRNDASASETDLFWMGKLAPFMSDETYRKQFLEGKTIKVLLCPAAPVSRYFRDPARQINQPGHTNSYWGSDNRPWEWGRSSGLSTICSYTINGWVTSDASGLQPDTPGKTFTSWLSVRPDVPVLGDGLWAIGWPQRDWSPTMDPVPPDLKGSIANSTLLLDADKNIWRFCINRHSKNVQLIFKDMHVGNVQLEKLWELPWHANYETPTAAIHLPSN